MSQNSDRFIDITERHEEAQAEYDSIMRCNDPDDLSFIIDRVMSFRVKYKTELCKEISEYANLLGDHPENSNNSDKIEDVKGVDPEKNDAIDEELQTLVALHGSIFGMGELLDYQISKLAALNNKNAIKLSQKGLVNQLSIFSIVLTVLTFILNNGKLFSIDGISFSMIIAGNISFILMCLVMFTVIYLFLHMEDGIKYPVIKAVVLGFIILVLCGLTYLLSTASDNTKDNAIPTTNSIIIDAPVPIEKELFPLTQEPTSEPKP